MNLGRYSIPDAYTLEEFRRRYDGASVRGRIKLLHRPPRAGQATARATHRPRE